jgi:GNAT superfamily N-acetyltransferase
MTRALALRIAKSEADHFESWLSVMQAQEGNPFGIEIRRFGRSVALVNRGMTLGPLFNRVLGFGDTEAGFLEEIVQFYAERDISCRIDINPYDAGPALFGALAASGLHPFRFHGHLYGLPLPEDNGPIAAREIRPEELPVWADIWFHAYAESLGVPPVMAEQIAGATCLLYGQPGWGLYLAFAEGQPAAAGALYVQEGVASLLVGGTLPEFRRRGCQKALLQARMVDAARHGCDLIAAQAGLDTTSQHNMERVGMRIAYTRAFWLRQ